MSKKKLKAPVQDFIRPFNTDYAGAWNGSCKTRETALIAAVKHIVNDGYSKATITDKRTGKDVARVSLDKGRRSATIDVLDAPFKRPIL